MHTFQRDPIKKPVKIIKIQGQKTSCTVQFLLLCLYFHWASVSRKLEWNSTAAENSIWNVLAQPSHLPPSTQPVTNQKCQYRCVTWTPSLRHYINLKKTCPHGKWWREWEKKRRKNKKEQQRNSFQFKVKQSYRPNWNRNLQALIFLPQSNSNQAKSPR